MTKTKLHLDEQQQEEEINTPTVCTPFLTISHLIHRINKTVADLDPLEAVDELSEQNDCEETQQQQQQRQDQRPQFELQRRFPDGSTRRATLAEQKAADMESTLQQVAASILPLPPNEQWAWLQQQKQCGNQCFAAGQYEQAMDVYLSCVLVIAHRLQQRQKQKHLQSSQPKTRTTTSESEKISPSFVGIILMEEDRELIFYLHIMNNLAQSSLQLSGYHKTIQFCNFVLHDMDKVDDTHGNLFDCIRNDSGNDETARDDARNSSSTTRSNIWYHQVSKLYFKRAKAGRLRGDYDDAHKDLNKAEFYHYRSFQHLHSNHGANKDDDGDEEEEQHIFRVVQNEIARERQHIKRGIMEARKNFQRQQRGMQMLLGGNNGALDTCDSKNSISNHNNEERGDPSNNNQEVETTSVPKVDSEVVQAVRPLFQGDKDQKYAESHRVQVVRPLYADNRGQENAESRHGGRAFSSLRVHGENTRQVKGQQRDSLKHTDVTNDVPLSSSFLEWLVAVYCWHWTKIKQIKERLHLEFPASNSLLRPLVGNSGCSVLSFSFSEYDPHNYLGRIWEKLLAWFSSSVWPLVVFHSQYYGALIERMVVEKWIPWLTSLWLAFLSFLGRIAQELLVWMGDDEFLLSRQQER